MRSCIQMNYLHVILISTLVESTRAIVDCRTACRKCKAREDEHKVMEIYCSMCKECRDHKREIRKLERSEDTDEEDTESVSYPSGCPTPPACESEDPDDDPVTIVNIRPRTTILTITTTTTTSTTTKPPCPPIPSCLKKKKIKLKTVAPPPCMPCMPLCAAPCPATWPPWQTAATAQAATDDTVTDPDFYYVYVGVPKEMMTVTKVDNVARVDKREH